MCIRDRLVIAEGGSLVGTYTCMSYPDEAYKMGNGYSFWGYTGGTYYFIGEEFVPINEGETMSVIQNGDGSYTFTGTGFAITGTIAAE